MAAGAGTSSGLTGPPPLAECVTRPSAASVLDEMDRSTVPELSRSPAPPGDANLWSGLCYQKGQSSIFIFPQLY